VGCEIELVGGFLNLHAAFPVGERHIVLHGCRRQSRQGPAAPGDILQALPGFQAERIGERRAKPAMRVRVGKEAPDRRTLADNVSEQPVQPALVGDAEHVVEGFCEHRAALGLGCTEQGAPRLGQQARGGLVVQHAEMAGDIRLQRKLMQQRFAEGMDRLDLEAAGRFERAREELPRLGKLQPVRKRAFHLRDLAGQRFVIERGPVRQPFEHAVRHLRGRRLRVGKAEDRGGPRAGQHQADHPLGQHVRLARSGIGGHPDRIGGAGGEVLASRGLVDGAIRHRPPPRHRPPTIRRRAPDGRSRRRSRGP